MTEQELSDFNLTEKDFQLLVDGLDVLPSRGASGKLLVDMLGSMMIDDDAKRSEFEKKRKAVEDREESTRKLLIEDIRILQEKLLTIKRYMQDRSLFKEVDGIINR